jgi:predicted glycogen debranching enzyme
VLAHQQNTVFLRYRIVPEGGPNAPAQSFSLALRPAMHFRAHDAPVSKPIDPYTLSLTGDRFEVSTGGPLPSLKMRVEGDSPVFKFYPEQQEKVNYRWEEARGYAAHGTLWSPGHFRVNVSTQTPASLVASSETWDTMNAVDPARAWQFERERRVRLLHTAPGAMEDQTTADLALASDQFVIVPAGRVEDATRARAQGEELRSVIAGYHWFTDWGRDTMISLEGLTLCTGRFTEARFILHSFARYVRNGLIPNLFPEGAHVGLYHTADASLWFFQAVARYLTHTGDRETLRLLLPTLESIAQAHVQGTSFGIGVDPADGLLTQGQDGYALTWMDALCDGWVVTPRRGKAVEINALWYNAMSLLARWVEEDGRRDVAESYLRLAERTRESFNRQFWDDQHGYLADVIARDGNVDWALRPNQIFAISLTHPVLDQARWRTVVDRVGETLLTPVGLRSLDPNHSDFKATYHGDLRTRDAAYHQGTVWSWLLGPFVDAWLKVYPGQQAHARALLQGLREHLEQACIGQVAEIFDAQSPFLPRGCVAQAWGVAELLRAWRLTQAPSDSSPPTAEKGPQKDDRR